MARLQFCDYYNMVAILEKSKHNIDFHPIVDFVEASPLRYALTFKPTVYVSHIRQFWSTARIETMEEGTKILATVDGILRTVTESSLRRNLKLQDKEGISSLPDAALFENLTLMGYNISPNQKFTIQKGQFSHQWKYLIHTIMQCMSPKGTGFNEFSSNIATALGKGSGTPTEPHYTPSPEAQQTSSTTPSSPTLPSVTTAPIPTVTSSDTPTLRQYTRRARITQSSALPPVADELTSPLRDVSEGEAYPIDSGFKADQESANIAKSSILPYDSAPRVTSPAADEGSMQLKLDELTALCTSLQRKHSEMVAKFKAQELEIHRLKARVKLFEDKEGLVAERSRDDAPINGKNLDEGEASAKRVSDDTEEMATVLTSMDAASVFSNLSKETMVESETLKKKKVQEQIDAQVARELEEQMAREDQRMSAQVARDAEIARIHAEKELQIMIDGLDKSNETVAKYLQEYHQFALELPLERRIELISDLVRGMTFKELEAKFTTVLKQIKNFTPMGSKEEAERVHHVTSKDKEIFMLVEKDYPLRKDYPFNLVAYSDSHYAGASLDKKSTTSGCQFLGCRLISWQCKKKTIVATSSTEAEYVVAAYDCTQGEKSNMKFLEWNLHCVSAKRTVWNGFSCSMASAIICLATDNLSSHTTRYTSPALTGVEAPLFASMMFHPTPYTSPSSPPQSEPTTTTESTLSLLTTLMDTCATLSNKVAELEQDKHTQALEIIKLKKMVKKLERRKNSKSSGLKRLRKVSTSQRVESSTETILGRIDDDNAATKNVNAGEPTMFADEEYDYKEENIDWNAIAEQVQEKHLDNIKKYQNLTRKPVFIAQARKNMIIYLKNMAGYKMEHFRGMTYDKRLVKEKFSTTVPIVDKEKALWVEFKRLFESDEEDVMWKL
nr:putative ribonuclease H-like domain-containing protein [Tanacetum cinerariifolium]